MINWKEFKKLIGNGKKKYLQRGNQKYHFVSYNKELKEITIMNTKGERTLRVLPLKDFITDFIFTEMTNEKPLF